MKKLTSAIVLAVMPMMGFADQVINDDLIVDGSQCVGIDCASGLNFGFDTQILKENNVRLLFDDTSSSGSFPKTDWRLEANDSNNGGEEYFAIDNVTNNVTPFKIVNGAGNNAMVIDAQGDIGIGTSTPVLELQVTDGDTPGLRLEQNNSAGWGSQTWDVSGNETNFFIRDVSHSSKLPFRIFPDTADDSLVLKNGRIGMMTDNPQYPVHLKKSDGTTQVYIQETSTTKEARDLLVLENNGNPQIQFYHTGNGNKWYISAGLNLVIKNNAGSTIFTVTPEGDVIFKKSDDVTDVSLQALVDYIETTHNTTIPSTTP